MTEDNALFKILVQVDGQSEELLVHGYDQPEVLCREFINKHNLTEKEFEQLLSGVNACIESLASSNENAQFENEFKTLQSSPKGSKNNCKSTNPDAKRPSSHKVKSCVNDINPTVRLLETASKKKRFRILTRYTSPQKEIFLFKPQLSKKSIKLAGWRKSHAMLLGEKSQKCLHHVPSEEQNNKKISLIEARKIADRLNSYSKKYEENTNLIRKITEDEQANFFTPKIGRPPHPVRSAKKPKLNYDFIKGPWKKILIPQGNVLKSSKSQSILNQVKKRRFREIFEMLNPQNDVVNIRHIHFENIPQNLLKIISPLLEELAEVEEGLMFEDFSEALRNLVKTISVAEKSVLYDIGKKTEKQALSFTFHPKINSVGHSVTKSFLQRSDLYLKTKLDKIA